MSQEPNASLLDRLKERKLVQWALAYSAGALVVVSVMDALEAPLGLSVGLQRVVLVLISVGFFAALVLAWYHGEQGRQRLSGPELLILATLLFVGGIGLRMVNPGPAGELEPSGERAEPRDIAAELLQRPGIAVLPFANRSGLEEDRYFTDGFQDGLLQALSSLRGLRVISRTSVEAYRDSGKTIPQIGTELGVPYVLEGAVTRGGDSIRISLQLVDAQREGRIWGEDYVRKLTATELLGVQSEIVQEVAAQLSVTLQEEETQRLARLGTSNDEAYRLYMRARGTPSRLERIELLDRAVSLDDRFVLAHAALAQDHSIAYQFEGDRTTERAEAARAAAEKALELDRDSEAAMLAMGQYQYGVVRDWEAALDWLDQASDFLQGNYSYHFERANTERRLGRWEAALQSYRATIAVAPQSCGPVSQLGVTLSYLRRYAEADELLRRATEMCPGSTAWWRPFVQNQFRRGAGTTRWEEHEDRLQPIVRWVLAMLQGRWDDAIAAAEMQEVHRERYRWYPTSLLVGWSLQESGRSEEALVQFEAAASVLEARIEQYPFDERLRQALGRAYAELGRETDALREAEQAVAMLGLERDAVSGPANVYSLALVKARLGLVDEALDLLDQVLSVPSDYTSFTIERDFHLRSLWDDPRFTALMEKHRGRVF